MNTYMTVQSASQLESFHAQVYFENNCLVLMRLRGFKKALVETIDLCEAKHVYFDAYLGGERISFTYQDKRYYFYPMGRGVIEYFKINLLSEAV